MPKTPLMQLMAEARQTADNTPDQYLGYSPADVDYLIKHYAMREPSSSVQDAIEPGAAMLMSPVVGLKGALRGALSIPGFLGDIANYAHGATSIATGHPENVTMPDDFKYGQQGLADWLAKNVPGLGYDEQLPQADAMGELLGNLTPTRIVRHAAGVAAKPIRAIRTINAPTEAAAASVRSIESPRAIRTSAPKQLTQSFAAGGLARIAARLGAEAVPTRRGVAEVIKNKGGNWLSGSVEGALSSLKKLEPQRAWNPDLPVNPINQWVDKPLTKYVKNEMATPEDPLRALAEKGILHFEPSIGHSLTAETNRDMARRSGDMPMARNVAPPRTLERLWENVADAVPRGNTYIEHLPFDFVEDTPDQALRKLGGQFAVDNPNARALGWDSNTTPADLGFNHLIDELSNAINPESGLPRELQFPADRLGKVSVPQAVERVAQINEWRAAQKAIADQAKADNAATVLHKGYPENNPKGLRWVELKKPTYTSDNLPSGFGLKQWDYKGKPVWTVFDSDGIAHSEAAETAEEAVSRFNKSLGARNPLQDALKYEGDTMGHCVGGYCDDVASGRSRIYSLRDAKGQPHTTIEVRPAQTPGWQEIKNAGGDPLAVTNEAKRRMGLSPDTEGALVKTWDVNVREQKQAELDKHMADIYREQFGEPPAEIIQIKGKGNLKPADEYQPFVQDFVRSGKWSDVGDLQNAGLQRLEPNIFAGSGLGDYATQEEIDTWRKNTSGFAKGGSIGELRDIITQLRAKHAR